jgi:hypothetical protein
VAQISLIESEAGAATAAQARFLPIYHLGFPACDHFDVHMMDDLARGLARGAPSCS